MPILTTLGRNPACAGSLDGALNRGGGWNEYGLILGLSNKVQKNRKNCI